MLNNTTTPIYKRLEDYRRLFAIARDLASTLDLDQLLSRIVNAAVDITDAEAASILLYDNAARQLYFQAATNIEQPAMRGMVVPLEGSIAGWMVKHREAVRVTDVHHDPRHFNDVDQVTHLRTRSLLGVPLIAKDKVVGVLEAINKRRRDFSDTDEDLMSVLGAQAAVAIENARLFQQSDLISEFVHELRTPLASLSTATYLLLRPEISQEQREQIVHNIHSETLRLNALTSSFLDLARLESGRILFRYTPFNLADLLYECKDVMQARAQQENVSMAVVVPDNMQPLEADRDKLKQVLLNLLSNAIKYNRPQGKVTISGQVVDSEMCISIIDTGIGIPDEAIPHLFEKFYRVRENENKADGTGLGLSICKQIVQGHAGRIEVQSKLGQGTIFTIHMPLRSKGVRGEAVKR